MRERVREGGEKGDDRFEAGNIRKRGAVFKGGEANVPVVDHHQNVLVPVVRSDGTSSRQIGRRPRRFGDGEGVTGKEGVNRGRGWW